jgi:hypothetical protein
VKPWHEQDAFWEDLEDHLFSPARLEQAAASWRAGASRLAA